MINQYEIAEHVVAAGYGGGAIGAYKSEVAKIVQERIGGLCADHRTFVYIRANNLHVDHGLGGGNITSALAAFSALSLLTKICYFIDKPQRFTPHDSVYFTVSETDAFSHFVKLLCHNGIELGVDKNDIEGQKLIWNGFRDYLAHLGTVEHGKQVIAFEFKQPKRDQPVPTLDARIEKMSEWQVFAHDDSGRNWSVYIDVLFAKLERIILPLVITKVIEHVIDEDEAARNLYKLVSGERYLP